MAKSKEVFVCQTCGSLFAQMAGSMRRLRRVEHPGGGDPAGPAAGQSGAGEAARSPTSSFSLAAEAAAEQPRLATGSAELDRVLGGGLVAGSVTLIGGDPGIGKSTLMLQAAAALNAAGPVLYATGEESLKQVALRARRLGLAAADRPPDRRDPGRGDRGRPRASRRARSSSIRSKPCIRSVSRRRPARCRSCANARPNWCASPRRSGTAVLLVGHVTKEGQIAGPRVLEHMVDTVLYFESDTGSRFRVLRSVKNRFGAANEIGVFAMAEQGLREVANPSAIFLSRHAEPVSGSVITVMREGTRSLLIEVQVLADAQPGRQSAARCGRHRRQPPHHAAGRRAPPRRASRCRARMCSPTWSAACASRRRRAISRSCWPPDPACTMCRCRIR